MRAEFPQRSRDAHNRVVVTWKFDSELWAEVKAMTGTERMEAARVDSDVSHTITIRHNSRIKSDWRLLDASETTRIFNVRAVLNPTDRRDPTVLLCTEDI